MIRTALAAATLLLAVPARGQEGAWVNGITEAINDVMLSASAR